MYCCCCSSSFALQQCRQRYRSSQNTRPKHTPEYHIMIVGRRAPLAMGVICSLSILYESICVIVCRQHLYELHACCCRNAAIVVRTQEVSGSTIIRNSTSYVSVVVLQGCRGESGAVRFVVSRSRITFCSEVFALEQLFAVNVPDYDTIVVPLFRDVC